MMRCLNCFEEFDEKESICLHCGKSYWELKNKANCLQPGTTLNRGRYIVGKALNAGGFGIVYKAFDTTLNIVIAIKEFFPASLATRVVGGKEIILVENTRGISYEEAKENFLTEAKIMEKFKTNENVVSGRDWFEENNTAYIVMEFIDGINVRDFMLQGNKKMDLESVQWITKQVIHALKDIHEKGYIFRDLTPDNIMITTEYDEEGRNIVKLIDFGAAVNMNTKVDTATDDVILKPGYAPIEQYVSGGILGPYTDIYALGATIHRMLSGLVPFEVTDRNKEDHLEKLVDLDPTIPEYIDRSVMKAMAIDKKIRFQTVDEFEAAFIHEQEVLYPEEELKKLKRKKKVFFCLFASVCIALAGFSFYIKDRRDQGIKNIAVKKDTITVMIPYSDQGSTAKEIDHLQEIVDDFEKEYEQITVKAEFVKQSEYFETLNQKETLPTVFFIDEKFDESRLANIKELLDSINLDNYYYFNNAKDSFHTSLPLAFDVAVCYVNEDKEKKSKTNIKTLEIEDLQTKQIAYNYDYFYTLTNKLNKKDITLQYPTKEQFLKEEVTYYVGNVSEWEDIYDAMPGYWSAKPFIKSEQQIIFKDYVAISNESSENQQNAGMLFIYELLSDLAQNNRYLQSDNHYIPVNKETEELYFEEFHKEFQFIKERDVIFPYYLHMIEENEKLKEKYK